MILAAIVPTVLAGFQVATYYNGTNCESFSCFVSVYNTTTCSAIGCGLSNAFTSVSLSCISDRNNLLDNPYRKFYGNRYVTLAYYTDSNCVNSVGYDVAFSADNYCTSVAGIPYNRLGGGTFATCNQFK